MNKQKIDNLTDNSENNNSQLKTRAAQFFTMGAASFALASFSSTAIIPVVIAGGVIGGLMLAEAGYKAYKNNSEQTKTGVENIVDLSPTTEEISDSIQAIRNKMNPNDSNSNKPKNQ